MNKSRTPPVAAQRSWPTVLKAVRWHILRDRKANGLIPIDLRTEPGLLSGEEPIRVCTLINEAQFLKDNLLVHLGSVFLEDRIHDWNFLGGIFRYYTRVADRADVLLVFEETRVPMVPKFDPDTGKPLEAA